MPTSLDTYIAKAREKKLTDERIRAELASAGWSQTDIDLGLALGKKNDLLIPPPPPRTPIESGLTIQHTGMWTGFLYILFFISLYTFAGAIAGILYNMVDALMPNFAPLYSPYNYNPASSTDMLMQIYLSALVVSGPIFFYLAFYLQRQLAKDPTAKNIRSRKLLIYITLIVTFLILLTHIIGTIYTFIAGNTTINSLGHLGVTLLTAGSIFIYFLSEVKNDNKNA